MEPQKTQNCQGNPEEKELSWRHNPSILNTTNPQSENSVVLSPKQAYRSLEHSGEPQYKATHLWSVHNKGGKNIQW